MKKVSLILVILAMTAPLTLGTTLYVDDSYVGMDTAYFSSIQGAWDAAVDNDIIDIYSGVDGAYLMANLNNVGKHGITMRAHATGDELLYEHVEVYNPGSNNIYTRGPDRMTFEGLIFRGKGQDYVGNDYGIYVRSPWAHDLTFDHCIFTQAGKYAAYFYHSGSNITIDHSSFIRNKAGLRMNNSSTLGQGYKVTNSLFYDNQKWSPENWDTDLIYHAAQWSGYAASLNQISGEGVPTLQNSVSYKSFSLTPLTNGLSDLGQEAVAGTGNLFNVSKPTLQSANSGSAWFGYLTSDTIAAIANGADDGSYMGARPTIVPEPATISLLMLGLLGLRRRRK